MPMRNTSAKTLVSRGMSAKSPEMTVQVSRARPRPKQAPPQDRSCGGRCFASDTSCSMAYQVAVYSNAEDRHPIGVVIFDVAGPSVDRVDGRQPIRRQDVLDQHANVW
jgi:hypothetical protein